VTGMFSVQTSEMLGVSDLAADAAIELRGELERLTQAWEDLSATWTGTAARAFGPEFDEWSQGARKVIESLDGEARLLAQHAYSFTDTDTGNAGSVGGL
jgi:WXG100 family type VII secretion target